LYRAAGFDNFKVSAGSTVWATPEERRWYADRSLARLSEGDIYRASWLARGMTESDIEETKKALQVWAETDDAWHIAVQADMLGWK
ncbi:methyltransferase-UbiE family protein, partial [Magnaporthiopsis poae ATCC 64411]